MYEASSILYIDFDTRCADHEDNMGESRRIHYMINAAAFSARGGGVSLMMSAVDSSPTDS